MARKSDSAQQLLGSFLRLPLQAKIAIVVIVVVVVGVSYYLNRPDAPPDPGPQLPPGAKSVVFCHWNMENLFDDRDDRRRPGVDEDYDNWFARNPEDRRAKYAKLARESGVDVMLAGDGGDELFGGNSRYARQLILEAYGNIPTFVRDHVLEPALLGRSGAHRLPGVRKAASYVEQARVPMPDRMQMSNLAMHIGFAELLTPEFLAGLDTGEPGRLQRAVYEEIPNGSLINRMLAYDWRFTLADNDLPKVLGATDFAGVDVRFPFLDDAVVDLSLRLPPNYKLRGLTLRWFFKQASRGFLPDAILRKKKHGFGLPFGVWLTGHAPLQELAFESVRALGRRGIVRTDFVERLLARHVHEHPAYYGELVFIFTMLEQWLAAQKASPAP